MAEASKLKKRKRMAEVDLLSKLPEDLLVNILSRIPTKEAMATMILSKRWRSIWRNLPCLEFDINDKNYNNFGLILNNSLLQIDEGPFLKTLFIQLRLTRPCPADLDMGKYVEKAINRKVANLELHLGWSVDPILLPKTFYTCKTLVTLSLSGNILLEDSAPASFPCLKTLALYFLRYKNEESVVSFLSNCPVLEVLIVERRKSVDANLKKFMVKVPSLREFSYESMFARSKEGHRDLVMDTPSLKNFKLESWESGAFCKIQTKMPLDDAFIDIMDGSAFLDDNFLKSMASLITLRMRLTRAMVRCCYAVKFSRLKECKIIPDYSDWLKPVMSLLASSPKLKKLHIQHVNQADDICWPDSWKEPSCIPECLSSHLEVFEWKEYGGSEVEKQFITYILGNSICLKTLKISILKFEYNTCEEEEKIMEDLNNIFRVSTTSHIERM